MSGAGRGLVDGLAREGALGEAPQPLALGAEVEVSIGRGGEVISAEPAVRVGDRPGAQWWWRPTLEAITRRRLASLAPIADPLPRWSAQGMARRVEQATDRLPCRYRPRDGAGAPGLAPGPASGVSARRGPGEAVQGLAGLLRRGGRPRHPRPYPARRSRPGAAPRARSGPATADPAMPTAVTLEARPWPSPGWDRGAGPRPR